jgi:hypothetical protein
LILSNYTFSVEYSHALLFENILQKEILPDLRNLNYLVSIKTYKLLSDIETGGQNLSMQLFFDSISAHEQFESNQKLSFLDILDKKFAGKYVYFQTLLEEF